MKDPQICSICLTLTWRGYINYVRMQESLPGPGMKALSPCPRGLHLLIPRRDDSREVGNDL